MTREEALYELANAFKYNIDDRLQEAIDMAISALSEEENRPIKVRDDGTLFVKVLDVSKVERVIIGDDSMAIREDFPKPFSNNITESPNDVDETDDEVIEPSDIISRADAMDKCKDAENELTDEAERKGARVVRFIIGELPSADAVHGEWIMHGEPPWLVRECSECGTKWHQWSGDSNPNYCGNCGARMKGGAE